MAVNTVQSDTNYRKATFRDVADAAPSLLWMANEHSEIIYFNKNFLRFVGLPEDYTGVIPWETFVPPDELPAVKAIFSNAFENREAFSTEHRIMRADGQLRWLLASGSPIYQDDGQFNGFIGSNIDITERKNTELALKESEERFRTMADSAPVLIFVTDKEPKNIYVNRKWLEYTGLSLEKALGSEWISAVHPDDVDDYIQKFMRAFSLCEPLETEVRVKKKNGEYGWLLVSAAPRFTADGQFVGYIGSGIDITDRKQAAAALSKSFVRERLLRRIVQIINQTFDLDKILNAAAKEIGQYFSVDRAFIIRYSEVEDHLSIELFGQYYRAADVPVINMNDFPPELLKLLSKNLPLDHAMRLQRLNTPEEYYADLKSRMQDLTHLTAEEQARYAEHFKAILIDKCCTRAFLRVGIYYRGTPFGVITLQQCQNRVWLDGEIDLLQDIATQIGVAFYQTDLYHKELQARQASEEANRKKSDFLAMISHELRTPLNSILGYSRMVENGMAGPVSDKQKQYLYNVHTSGNHLLNIINDLLDIAKAEAGMMEISPEAVEVAPLIREVSMMMEKLAEKKQVRLSFEIQPGLDTIEADPARFKQILINLVNNAIKFNRDQGTVYVRLGLTPDRQWMTGRVEDTGFGIPKDKLPELFKKFYQADTSSSRNHEGTGLGLALAKELLELHGGEIAVESEEGVGTTFTFRLPAVSSRVPVLSGNS